MQNLDSVQFEREWTKLGLGICQTIYSNPEIQKLRDALQNRGYLSIEEKGKFIDICNRIKYEIIFQTYGKEGSEGYAEFIKNWNSWFQNKAMNSMQDRSRRNSVDHILVGSSPDPEVFLLNFEKEISENA